MPPTVSREQTILTANTPNLIGKKAANRTGATYGTPPATPSGTKISMRKMPMINTRQIGRSQQNHCGIFLCNSFIEPTYLSSNETATSLKTGNILIYTLEFSIELTSSHLVIAIWFRNFGDCKFCHTTFSVARKSNNISIHDEVDLHGDSQDFDWEDNPMMRLSLI